MDKVTGTLIVVDCPNGRENSFLEARIHIHWQRFIVMLTYPQEIGPVCRGRHLLDYASVWGISK
jgi:hypothetical protein